MAKRGAAVLEMPERKFASAVRAGMRLRRDPMEDFADEYEAVSHSGPERGTPTVARSAVKLKVRSRLHLPTTVWGMVGTGLAMVLLLATVFWLTAVTRVFLLNDARFRIAGPTAIEIVGNHHLGRGQLLGMFSDDLERNIFGVSLDQRQGELEMMPWVERATVMRLLPGRLRVAIVERTPVAFVRQGSTIGLVDKDGVLLVMVAGARAEHYAFPVVTGIVADDPASVRSARMRLFTRFTSALDGGGAKNMESLSEVDLSNPEDVRALVEDKGTTVLAHFGEENFRERFDRMKALLPQWRAQYPNLASADMRYEHEIPLGMATVRPVTSTRKQIAVSGPIKVGAVKPVVRSAVAAKPLVKAVVPISVKMPPLAKRSFVAAAVAKPWQPVATASAPANKQTSVSVAARSLFVAKPPVSTAPVPIVVKSPIRPSVKAAPQTKIAPAPKAIAVVPEKPTAGKPSAAKPLLTNDTNQFPTRARR